VEAVRKGVQVCQAVASSLVSSTDAKAKQDRSPVTIADFASQAVIINEIRKVFPDDKIVAEEHSSDLQANPEMREKVVKLVNSVFPPPAQPEDAILSLIDYRGPKPSDPATKPTRFWTIDPVDGTAGFLRGEQYAVCLALIENSEVVVGALGCPNLPQKVPESADNGPINVARSAQGSLLVAVAGQASFMRSVEDSAETRIHTSLISDPKDANFCESVESGHSSHSESGQIASLLGITRGAVRMDSQCKYAAIARGDASIYLRLSKATYHECIWDHAAGWLIVKEAGGHVTDLRGKALDFSLGSKLSGNHGVVATNGILHSDVLKAIDDVLFPPIHNFKMQINAKTVSSSSLKSDKPEGPTKLLAPETIQQILASGLGIDPSLIVVVESAQ